MKQIKKILVIVTISLLLATVSQSANKQIIVSDGDIQASLEQQLQQDRWELVMIWATYCHVCKEDFKKLATFIVENPEVPLTIIGVVIDGLDEKEKTKALVKNNKLDYAHILTDLEHATSLYQSVTNSSLIGTPSYLLYNTQNKLVAFNNSAIDLDALEIMVYE